MVITVVVVSPSSRHHATRNARRRAPFHRFPFPFFHFSSRVFREIRVFSFAALLTRPDRREKRRKNRANGNHESRA